MSLRVLKEIIFVSMGDELIRRRIIFHPDDILPKYDLTDEELVALRLGDKDKLKALGLDENLAAYGAAMFSRTR